MPSLDNTLTKSERIELQCGLAKLHEKGIQPILDFIQTHSFDLNDGFDHLRPFSNDVVVELYTMVYKMITQRDNHASAIYDDFVETYLTYLKSQSIDATEPDDLTFLNHVNTVWKKSSFMAKWTIKIFQYVDRYYVRWTGQEPLKRKAEILFDKHIFGPHMSRIVVAYLTLIETDREKSLAVIDDINFRPEYKPVVDIRIAEDIAGLFTTMSRYSDFKTSEVAPGLRNSTRAFYQQKASIWLNNYQLRDYLKLVDIVMGEEEARCDALCYSDFKFDVQEFVQLSLLTEVQQHLLGNTAGILKLLDENAKEDLYRSYVLFSRIDSLAPISAAFKTFIMDLGQKLVVERKAKRVESDVSMTEQLDTDFVLSLLSLHSRVSDLLTDAFAKEFKFCHAMKEAFEEILAIEMEGTPMATMLCYFVDRLIRRTVLKDSKSDINQLNNVTELFGYLTDKDLFLEGHRVHLAKRLIGREVVDEVEKNFVDKLKDKCGDQLVAKHNGMIRDIEENQDLCKKFVENESIRHPDYPPILIQSLMTGYWPIITSMTLTLPREISSRLADFEVFYGANTAHRKLMWAHSAGQAILMANYSDDVFEITCNTFQASILLSMFNDGPFNAEVSYAKIKETVGMDGSYLKKTLKSLYGGKYPILNRVSSSVETDNAGPYFQLNANFKPGVKRIRLQTPLLEETMQKTVVQMDRTHSVQAAIVRALKISQRLDKESLVKLVSKKLSVFRPSITDIDNAIRVLVGKDFIEEETLEDGNVEYTYVS